MGGKLSTNNHADESGLFNELNLKWYIIPLSKRHMNFLTILLSRLLYCLYFHFSVIYYMCVHTQLFVGKNGDMALRGVSIRLDTTK